MVKKPSNQFRNLPTQLAMMILSIVVGHAGEVEHTFSNLDSAKGWYRWGEVVNHDGEDVDDDGTRQHNI